MTYNFDPDRWYENEIAYLKAARDRGELSPDGFEQAVERTERRLQEMWQRLDGTYRIEGDCPARSRR